jgi:LysR family transcriptional regulator, glycine cleavage system transcriptional activator
LPQTNLLLSFVDKNSTVKMAARIPLNAILVFCAVARHGSFRRAAQELCVTPGAVSRQIQALENHVGQQLFERNFRDIRLTRAGEKLHARVAEKMASVEAEVELLRSGGRKTTVRVESGVTFAMHWLIPRLAAFHAANPGIRIQLSSASGPVNMSERLDLHIRRDPREFGRLKPEVFLEEQSILVASPKLNHGAAALSWQRLKRQQRIAAKSRPGLWKQWSEHHRLDPTDFEPTLELDNTILAIQAAIEGLGAMVVPEMFVTGMLDNRALAKLGGKRIRTGAYYILKRARTDSAAVRKFTDWLHRPD